MRAMRRGSRLVVVLVAISAVAGLAGCSTETKIDSAKAEDLVKSIIHGNSVPVKSVSCPDDITAKTGGTFDCTVTFANGQKATTGLKMTDDSGNVKSLGGLKPVK
jgi:uncharacterized lipoprotein